MSRMDLFERELTSLINAYSLEHDSDTPDFILAKYLRGCLEEWNDAVTARATWSRRGKVATGVSGPTPEA